VHVCAILLAIYIYIYIEDIYDTTVVFLDIIVVVDGYFIGLFDTKK